MKVQLLTTAVVTKIPSRSLLILMLVGVLFSLSVIPAFACAAQPAPSSYPQYSLKERIDHVSHVFSGTIVDVENGDTAVAVVRVTNYYKGSGPEIVRVNGFAMGADCQEYVEKNQQAVFFVSGSPATGFHAPSTLDVPNYVKPTEPLSSKLFGDITQVTGKEPSIPTPVGANPGPGQNSTSPNTGFDFGYLLVAGGAGVMVSGVVIYLIMLFNSTRN